MSKFFDTYTEKKVLAGMLHSEDTIDYAIANITTNDFENEDLSHLFDIIVRFYCKYYKRITRKILSSWLTKNNPKKKTQLLLLFTEIDALEIDEYSKYYINELKTFTLKRKLYSIHDRVTNGLNNDEDPDTLFTELSRTILTGGQTSFVYRTSVFDAPDERIQLYQDKRDHPEKYQGVPYGIEEIDALTGGMYSGQLYMIIGRTGSGKTHSLVNIGANVAKIGKTVMYCTIEMDAAIMQHMWEARETRIPLKSIMGATMSPEEEKKYINFIQESSNLQVPFYIVDIPQGCTTGIIDSEVVMFEKMYGNVPDIVLIDYANLISPVSKFKDRSEKYDHVFRELKEGARAHKTIYYTAAQMNRESLKSKEPGTEHVAFSDAASYHCDAIFRVFADKHAEENKDLQFEVIKGRYHEKACVTLLWMRDINLIASYGKATIKRKPNVTNYSGSAEHIQGSPEPDTISTSSSENFENY